MNRFKVNQNLSILLLLLIAAVISILYISDRQNKRMQLNAKAVDRTIEVISLATMTDLAAHEYVLAVRDKLNNSSIYKQEQKQWPELIDSYIQQLSALEGKKHPQKGVVDSMHFYINRLMNTAELADSIHRLPMPEVVKNKALMEMKARMGGTLDQISRLKEALQLSEQEERDRQNAHATRFLFWTKIALFIVLGFLLVVAGVIIYRLRTGFALQAASEQKFITLLEAAPDATIIADTQGIIVMANQQAEKLLGYTKKELLGMDVEQMVPASLREHHIVQRDKFAEQGSGRNMDSGHSFTAVRKDGSSIPVEISLSPIETHDGKFVAAALRDYSAKKLLEDALKKNNEELEEKVKTRTHEMAQREQQYRYLFENNPLPMWVFDLEDFRFLDVNEMAIQKYGYSKEEFLNMTLTDIRPLSDRERFLNFDHAWKMTTLDTNRGVWRHCKKNGDIIDVEVIAHSIEYQGKKARLVLLNDVTNRLKAERELQASEKKFRALIENSNDIIALLSADNQIIYRSPSAIRITGWTDEEMLHKDFMHEIVHPDDQERFSEVFRTALNSPGIPAVVFYRSLHRDGHYIDVEGVLINLLHRDYIRSFVLNLRDVTEQKKADNLLVAREKRFRSLIENSFDIILMLDDQFKVTYRSPSAERVSGRSDEDVLGTDPRENIHPEDLPAINAGIRRLLQAPGSSEHALFRFLNTKGNYMWMEGYATNLLQDENVKSIVFNYRDVTARVEAEERLANREKYFRALIENSKDVVVILNKSLTVVYRSPSAFKITGIPDEQAIGRDGRYSIHPEDQGSVNILLHELRSLEGKSLNLLFRFRCADGHYIWMEGSVTNLLHEESIEGYVFNLRDITDRIIAANALKEEQHKLEAIATSSPGLIYSFQLRPDGSMRFPYASNAMEEIFGYGHELINQDISGLLNNTVEEDRELFMASMLQSATTLSSWNLEFRFRHPKKGIIWIEGNSIPTRDADGTITWHGVVMDVTERKRTQEKISEQSAQLKTLSDNLPGVMIFQLAGDSFENRRFTYVSNEVTRLTGKKPEEVIADPSLLYNCILPEDLPLILLAEKMSYENQSVFNEEVRFRSYKGDIRWLNIISTPRKTESGALVWDGFHLDITERKQAENAIRESEARYRTLVEQAFDGILFYDVNGRILECNNSGANTIGYSREELLQMNVTDLFFEQDLQLRPLEIPSVTEENQVFDYRTMRRRDGTAVEIELVTRLLPDGRYLAVGRDITDQNKALSQQNLLSSIVNSTDDAILSTDKNGVVTSWNKGAEQIFGYTADEMIGRDHQELWPDEATDVEKAIMERIYTGEFLQHYETKRKRKDGTIIIVSITTSPLLNKNGELTGVSKVVRDITRQKEAEFELKRIAEENQLLYERLSIILNTLPASVALLDPNGVMVEVNDAWKNFADVNGFSGEQYGIGTSYLTVTQSFGDNEQNGKEISAGVQEVLDGKLQQFEYEYSWHRSRLKRWFRIVVTPLRGREFTGAVVMHMDISEIRRLEQERIESRIEEQRKITEAMLKGQEKERNAIGIELHDNVNQILVGTKVLLSVVRDFPEKTSELISSCIDNISLAVQENRKIAHELVTPNLSDENLLQQITRLTQTMLKNAGISTYINHESLNEALLCDELKLALYRVAQEQCTNIIKYSQAGQVIISLATKKDNFFMRIADDGHGSDPKKVTHGIGLKNMSSRLSVFGGTISIDTAPEQGFALEIEIPLHPVRKD